MTDFLLNPCGDLDYTGGTLTIVTGVDAIRQRWLIYIRTFLGEWYLDQSIGIPYYQRVLKKAVSRQGLKQVFKDGTLQVPGVLQVISVVVDSLDVAARTAEVTVTTIVTGDEGPETGVFKYTGEIPPGGCDVSAPVPAAIADQWYWFDPSDFDFVQGGVDGLSGPYVAGAVFALMNKFEAQQGAATMDDTGPTSTRIAAVLNGRKAINGFVPADPSLITGLGVSVNNVAALRPSLGHTGSFTVFGVYQPPFDPGALPGVGLMALDGLDADGVTRRWINVRLGANVSDEPLFRLEQDTVAGGAATTDTAAAAGVLVTDAWAFALRRTESTISGGNYSVWINGALLLNEGTLASEELEQVGELTWNAALDGVGVLTTKERYRIGDLIGYSAPLSSTDIANVFAYLTEKWGL